VAAGAEKGTIDRRVLKNIGLAWLVTVPGAAALGIAAYAIARALGA